MRLSLLVLLMPALAAAEPLPDGESHFSLDQIGLGAEVRHQSTRPSLTLTLPTRADRVLTAMRVVLVFAPRVDGPTPGPLELFVNQEHVATLDAATLRAPGEHVVTIDPAFFGEHNSLTFTLAPAATNPCADLVPAGTWDLIADGRIELRAAPLRLANDLGLLPLPFHDALYDKDPSLPIVFMTAPTPRHLQSAALVASWFGLRAGGKLHFPITVGTLPDAHAVVLVDGAKAAAQLGIEPPDGPSLRLMDALGSEGKRKLLVLAGRDLADVEIAARALALGVPLSGAVKRIEGPVTAPPAAAHDAPRWLPVSERIPLADIPGGEKLEIAGGGGGALRLSFRLSPDLFFWQSAQPSLDLGYSATLPPGVTEPPRVSIDLNRRFLATLRASRVERGQAWGRERLFIPADRLAGYDEIAIHFDYGQLSCEAAAAPARFTIDSDSALRLPSRTHFATLPHVALFVDDGFPFTRVSDLSQTALVVPPSPSPRTIESALSLVAHFAAITGRASTGLMVVGADDVERARDRDLLLVGAAEDLDLLARWRDRLPLAFDAQHRPFAQLPRRTALESLLGWLAARNDAAEVDRAEEIVSHDPGLAAAIALESPLARGRSAVIVTAATAAGLPLIADLQGNAESQSREADSLVASRKTLWMFRIGASYSLGQLGGWRSFLWFLSQHWVALFPFVLLGTCGLAVVLRASLREKLRARMQERP